ncbi:MAG: hypothetical protein QM715_05165 [Nibricoccus sp.]
MKNHQPKIAGLISAVIVLALGVAYWFRTDGPKVRPQAEPPTERSTASIQKPDAKETPALIVERKDDETAGIPLSDVKALIRLKLTQWGQTQTEDEAARERLLETMKALLTKENAAELTRMLSDDELSSPFGLLAFEQWLKVNPSEAANWMSSQPSATDLQARLVAQQLLSDEQTLNLYCNDLPDTGWKQTFLGEASLIAVAKSPPQAAALARQMKPGKEQTNALETIVYDWATRDLSGAIGLVGTIADPALREKTLVMTAKAIAMGDPDLGAQWLSNAVKTEGALKETAQSIVEIWSEKSPADAANWLSHSTDINLRSDAVDALARAWLKVDANAAQAWIRTLPEKERVEKMLKEEQAERERPKE